MYMYHTIIISNHITSYKLYFNNNHVTSHHIIIRAKHKLSLLSSLLFWIKLMIKCVYMHILLWA